MGRFVTVKDWRVWVWGEPWMSRADYQREAERIYASGWLDKPMRELNEVWRANYNNV